MKKKLIEVALPLDAINAASAREKSIRHGHPSTLHLWWARRPLAAARAVLFAQLVDDPSAHPELFPTEEDQQKERVRLFHIIEELVKWENTNNETVLNKAREEIKKSWAMTCKETGDDPEKLPAFHDPFAGGGSIPLEAQRLGLEAYASDLNPVAVLINKAMIEIPPKFANMPPVNPESRRQDTGLNVWQGAQGLAEDVRYYGKWMRDEAERRIGHLYPKVEVTPEMVRDRPDLKPYEGRGLTVIAWIWARTVKSPNPAFRHVDVPLVTTFLLAKKPGKEAYVDPIIEGDHYHFLVKLGKPKDIAKSNRGTKLARGTNFECLLSGAPITDDYVKSQGREGQISSKLMAIVAKGNRERIYLSPTSEHEEVARKAKPNWIPEGETPSVLTGGGAQASRYGFKTWSSIFTPRQLAALTTFYDLASEIGYQIRQDLAESEKAFSNDRITSITYEKAISVYLGFAIDKSAVYWNSLCPWLNQPKNEIVGNSFGRQAMPIAWDYAEANPLSESGGNIKKQIDYVSKSITYSTNPSGFGLAKQADATTQSISSGKIVSTDPPYYDNIPYADLSDFFYIWLRRSLQSAFPDLFTTIAVPKSKELVALAYRHTEGREGAEGFFLGGMTQAMHQLSGQVHPAFPTTIYYAFKQSESNERDGTTNTGWDTFLDAIINAGFVITGTWPFRTERQGRMVGNESNALASSIVLVCRTHSKGMSMTSNREFRNQLHNALPKALRNLQKSNIAPVDMAQAAIGPGMAIFSSYSKVLEADGTPMKVRTALALINEVLDEILAEQEGEMDGDTRWAVAWFEQYGMGEAPYGTAETLCNAKNTSMQGLVDAGIVHSKGGRVHLLRREKMDPNWDPEKDKRLTVWEVTQHLIQKLESEGEGAAAELIGKLGGVAEQSRDLAYRLFQICERKKWANEARSYNSLVIAWPELTRRAQPIKPSGPSDQSLF